MNDFVDEAIASCERLLGHRPDQAHIHRPDSKSVRLFLNDTTVIATRRKTPQRAELEVNVLKELRENGAPVPEILAYDGIWLMQEDVGRDRLSRKIYKTWESECERWLELALRVRLETLCLITVPCEPPCEESDVGDKNPCLCGGD